MLKARYCLVAALLMMAASTAAIAQDNPGAAPADSKSLTGDDINAIIANQKLILANQAALQASQARLDELTGQVEALKDEVAGLKKAGTGGMKIKPNVYLRLRPDFQHNVRTLGNVKAATGPGVAATSENDEYFYVGSRLQLGVTIEPNPNYRLVLTAQDSRCWGEEKNFRANTNGTLDIFEGYMDFLDIGGSGIDLRAGRFTMDYGSTMHVNSGGSGSTGQTYDGVRLSWKRPKMLKIDAFTTLVKTGLGPIFSADTKEDYESFTGLYLQTDSFVKWLDFEIYGFYLDDAFANFTQKLGTVGGRVILRPAEGLKLGVEAAAQFGKVSSWTADAKLQENDHLAAVYLANASYQFVNVKTKPLIGMFFLYASGDSTPWDNQSSAFKPTFGSTHNFLGYIDIFRAQGIWDIGPTFQIEPVNSFNIILDYHIFSQTADGGLYQHFGTYTGNGTRNGTWTNDRGVLIPAGNSSFLGHELDLTMLWRPVPWMEAAFAYNAYFPGPALDGAVIMGVNESKTAANVWANEADIGDLIAHRMLVWATFSY